MASALFAFILVAVLTSGSLFAQATGSISGTVTDASGSAVADTQVQVKNTGTSQVRTIQTDEQGRYRALELPIGNYEISASKMGFQTGLRTGVTLTVGSQPVIDMQLQVGAQTQTVTVEGQVSAVETQSTAVGALVESKQMRDLPLNGRNFTQLITLAPGVTQIPTGAPGAGSTFYGNGQKYSIAGSRPSGQAYLLDDQDMVNFWNNGPGAGGLGTALGVEAIQEFQALTNTYSAQFGGNGAVINASSKSGTNQLHGSLYEFLRNNKLEARNFFDRTTPPFKQNQFGAAVGGAIKKDKAFFFANYEGLRQRRTNSNIVVVPDACAQQFLATTASGSCGNAVTENANPTVRQAIRNTMALFPAPNSTAEIFSNGIASGTGRALVDDPLKGTQNYLLSRIDYTVSEKSSIFFRYVLDRAQRDFTTGIPWWPELDTTRDHFISMEERHIITPKLVNLAHIGYSRTWEDAAVYGTPVVANGVASQGTLATAGVHPMQYFGTSAGREDGTVNSFSGVAALGASTTLPFYLVPNKFQFGDDVVWSSGAHSIKAGASVTRMRENTWAPFQVGGIWTFANLAAFQAGNFSTIGGQVSDAQNPAADATKDWRYTVFSFYVDDQWKLSQKLTVNVGLRYSPTTKINSVRHLMYDMVNPPFTQFSPVTTATAANPSLRNWDPRIGLAFDPFKDHKTSIRASFGMFHNVMYSRDTNHWLQPPFATASQTPADGALYTGTCASACSPFNLPSGSNTVTIPANLSCTNCNYYGVHTTPYQMQWNFNIQRELFANTVLTAGYVGSHNLHLMAQRDFNNPVPTIGASGRPTFGFLAANGSSVTANPRLNPAFSSLNFADALATSHYHGLQTAINRRFSNGVQAQFSYTWSKSIDNSSGVYGLDGGGGVTNPVDVNYDRGLSNFNRKHNLRLSGIYQIPFKGKGLAAQALGNWQINGAYTFLSGSPFSPVSATNRAFTGPIAGTSQGRPDVVGGCDVYANQDLHGLWYNPACFTIQPAGTYGNVGRDSLIGPNLWNLDMALQKDWKVTRISEQFTLQFKAEFFNLLNHPSFQNPNGTVFSGVVATPSNLTGVGQVGAVNGSAGTITAVNSQPRQLQFALKIVF